MMTELLNVDFSYGDSPLIKNLSFKIKDGECMALTGSSGCGKSTVVKLIAGLEKPLSGSISAPEKISVVFQEDRFAENLSLIKNIRLVLNKEQYPLADSLIYILGLEEYKHKKISEFSGGMKRRAAIARAIAFGGDFLILDEPFNGIDKKNKEICAKLIKKHFLQKNKPVLLITHVEEDLSYFDNIRKVSI